MSQTIFRAAALREARTRAGLSQAGLEKLITDHADHEAPRADTPRGRAPAKKRDAPTPSPHKGYEWGRRVASWEGGFYQPRASEIPRLARALGLDPLELLDGGRERPTALTLRVAAGLTLVQLSAGSGVAYGTCQRVDRAVVKPSPAVAEKLAQVVGVSINDYVTAASRRRG